MDGSSRGTGPARPAALPLEIAFLAEAGIPPADLMRAARAALAWGVSPDRAALALPIIDETTFYMALARHLRVPFLRDGAEIAGRPATLEVLAAGAVMVTGQPGIRSAHAPRGPSLRRLLERRNGHWASIAIVTPTQLRRMLRERLPSSLAGKAAYGLMRQRPGASACTGLTFGQRLTIIGLAAVLSFLMTLAMDATLGLLMAVAAIPFFGLVWLRLTSVVEFFGTGLPPALALRIPDAALPTYTVLVPVYRERRILSQLVRSLRSLDYPAAKLEIKILVEIGDSETRSALGRFSLPPQIETVLVPDGMPRTKPRALNVGLAEATGTFVVVYDAEDVPDPMQLRLAAALFSRAPGDVACLQARLAIDNSDDSWLTRFATIEYAQLFDVLNPMLAACRLPLPLGGTSNHFRTAALRAVGGWDAWNVTEDADLGLRLATAGYRVGDLPSTTAEEAPATLRAWMAQRTRWFKGWMLVAITFTRNPIRTARQLGPLCAFAALALVIGTILTSLMFPICLAVVGWRLARPGDLLAAQTPFAIGTIAVAMTLFVTGLIAMVLPAREGMRRRRIAVSPLTLALLPAYYALMSVAAWRGFAELVRAPFQWNKTEHGLAQTSRTGALTLHAAAHRSDGPAIAPRRSSGL